MHWVTRYQFALQGAELVTVLSNTAGAVFIFLSFILILSHVLIESALPKAPEPRTAIQNIVCGVLFATEIAAYALIGWWFTLILRVFANVVAHTMPREKVNE